jgi:glycosyltransferase involved in cell wall biosynthesis
VLTFNNLGFNMELVPGKNIWDELGILCVNILMDHPYCHKAALDAAPANAAVLCPDRNHMRYVQRFYPNIPITGFLPHAGKKLRLEPKPISERSMDVFYAGSLSRKYAHDIIPDFSQYDFDAKEIADRAYQDLLTHPHKTAEDAIESALLAAGIHLSETDLCDFIESIHYIDMLATSHFREATVRTLVESGIDVYLCGSGWDVCTWLSNPHLHNLGRISADEVVRQMGDAKIVLSTMTWFKDGTHDRVFNGMLAGAVAVSDSSIYMREEFCGDPEHPDAELILFELEQISQLPQMLRDLLSSPARMQQIADKGRSTALAEHTWKHRAQELHQDLLQTL